jgi:hypothetical protein
MRRIEKLSETLSKKPDDPEEQKRQKELQKYVNIFCEKSYDVDGLLGDWTMLS